MPVKPPNPKGDEPTKKSTEPIEEKKEEKTDEDISEEQISCMGNNSKHAFACYLFYLLK